MWDAGTWLSIQKENSPSEENLHQLKCLWVIFVSLQNISYLSVSRFLTQRIRSSNLTLWENRLFITKALTQVKKILSKKLNEFWGNPFSLLYHQVTTQPFPFQEVLCNGLVLTQVQTQGNGRKEGRQHVEQQRLSIFTVPWNMPESEFRTQSRHRDFSCSKPMFWMHGCCCTTWGKFPPKHMSTVQWPQET